MARLINNKGDFYIEIHKQNINEIALFAIHGGLIEKHEETETSYIFEILENGYDGACSVRENEYRNILAKITCNNPEPELIIPTEVHTQEPPLTEEEYEKLKNGFDIMNSPRIFRHLVGKYPQQVNMDFLESLGVSGDINDANFKWDEENKLPNAEDKH